MVEFVYVHVVIDILITINQTGLRLQHTWRQIQSGMVLVLAWRTTVLVELPGGLKFHASDNERDINKLIPGTIEWISSTSAMTSQNVPISEYIIRFLGKMLRYMLVFCFLE